MSLLRWQLPSSGLSFEENNGTVLVDKVAGFLRGSARKIITATDPIYGNGKDRMIVLRGDKERIGALGGHGFFVPNVPGNKQVDLGRARTLKVLIHETDATKEIVSSGVLKCMGRETGINFTVGKRGSYRSRATHLFKLDVVKAVSAGFLLEV